MQELPLRNLQETTFKEQSPAPGTPTANTVTLYAKTDGKLYFKDDTGTETALGGSGGGGVPSGTVIDFAGTAAPTDYLLCDGSNVSRTTYADLFTAIGTTWGTGDGSTTFGLPDFRRHVSVGSGGTGTGTLGNAVGDIGGAETHTLSTTEMPSHLHTVAKSTGGGAPDSPGALGDDPSGTSNTGSAGGDGAHNNLQPSAIVLKVIKT